EDYKLAAPLPIPYGYGFAAGDAGATNWGSKNKSGRLFRRTGARKERHLDITDLGLVAPRVRVGRIKVHESHCGPGCSTGGDQRDCEKKGLEHVNSPVLMAGRALVRRIGQVVRTSER